jgi:hypothetical protein
MQYPTVDALQKNVPEWVYLVFSSAFSIAGERPEFAALLLVSVGFRM